MGWKSRKPRKPRYKRVTVYWGDASSIDAWERPDVPTEVIEIVTTGYLIRRTKTFIKIASSVDLCDGMVANATVIPREMIRRVKRL